MDFIEDVGKVGHFGETTQSCSCFLLPLALPRPAILPIPGQCDGGSHSGIGPVARGGCG